MQTLAELRAMSEDELVRSYDKAATHTSPGLNFWYQELSRRDSQAVADRMQGYAYSMLKLTRVILVLTLVNVVAALGAAVS